VLTHRRRGRCVISPQRGGSALTHNLGFSEGGAITNLTATIVQNNTPDNLGGAGTVN
jgi:hypothetical protein